MAEFQALIEKERERLTKLAEDYHTQIAEIQGKLAEVHREMRAITAYEEAKLDKPAPIRTPRAPRTTSTERAPRGSKREELIALVRDNPNISRGDILAKLDIVEKDNKAGAQSVSNALANLKKAGTVLNEGGKYRLAPT
jgi:hypothetical protein